MEGFSNEVDLIVDMISGCEMQESRGEKGVLYMRRFIIATNFFPIAPRHRKKASMHLKGHQKRVRSTALDVGLINCTRSFGFQMHLWTCNRGINS